MSTPFQAKIAFVTGGARHRRRHRAPLARDGATVAFTYRESGAAARALAAEIEAQGGRALAIQADAGDAASSRRPSTTPPRASAASTSRSTTPACCAWVRSTVSRWKTSTARWK